MEDSNDMNVVMTKRFNDSVENMQEFNKAKANEFPWLYFMNRIQQKAVMQGYLPENGFLVFEPRYIDSADRVLAGILRSMESVVDPGHLSQQIRPWEEPNVETWKQVLCCMSATMFDAGIVAACTKGATKDFDPIVEDGPAAVFGDVGFMGLRDKSTSFVRYFGGKDGENLMAEIGNDACVNLYWDKYNSEEVFKSSPRLREAYLRGACKGAYGAGAVFIQRLIKACARWDRRSESGEMHDM